VVFAEQPLRADPRFMTANMKLSRPAAALFFAERTAGTDDDIPASVGADGGSR
jgi:long-chain acyl-CoA synthetase